MDWLESEIGYQQNKGDEVTDDERDSYSYEDRRLQLENSFSNQSEINRLEVSPFMSQFRKGPNSQQDTLKFKGKPRVLIDWKNLHHDQWLNINRWVVETDFKKDFPGWYETLQHLSNDELIGRVLKCVGECRQYRGRGFGTPKYRSVLREGDDLITGKNSYLWAILIDGTLIRLSPYSSISLREVNIGKRVIFLHARINEGNVLWMSRKKKQYKLPDILKETDLSFLPLEVAESVHQKGSATYGDKGITEFLEKDNSLAEHYQKLNELIESNNKIISRATYSFLVAPNFTLYGESLVAEFYYNIHQVGHLKVRSQDGPMDLNEKVENEIETRPVKLFLRGYKNKKITELEADKWYVVDHKGKTVSEDNSIDGGFTRNEILSSRIPSILIAREIFIKKYSREILSHNLTEIELAKDYGHRFWGELERDDSNTVKQDLEKRLDFLIEYTRRVETSNLQAQEKLNTKYAKDEIFKSVNDFSDYHSRAFLHLMR